MRAGPPRVETDMKVTMGETKWVRVVRQPGRFRVVKERVRKKAVT